MPIAVILPAAVMTASIVARSSVADTTRGVDVPCRMPGEAYWQLGRDILERQSQAGWGAGIVDQLSRDLRTAFPELKGFSRTNLLYMRAFAEAWPESTIVQQAVGQLPWGHNLVLLTKLKVAEERLAYARRAIEHGWSRNVLVLQIEQRSLQREGTRRLR